MQLSGYLFAVAFYVLSGVLIYFCYRQTTIRMKDKEKTKMIFLSAMSAMTLGGVGFATFAFFYL